MFHRAFRPGDRVVYRLSKYKSHPSHRACGIYPAAHGDDYNYYVEKFWVVSDVLADGRLLLSTPRGKTRSVNADDLNLRHANWLEKIRYRERFLRSDMAAPVEVLEFEKAP